MYLTAAIETIKQTVAVGNDFSNALPTTTPTIDGSYAAYPSAAQGGLFIFGVTGSRLPPVHGATFTYDKTTRRKLVRIIGDSGDATALALYIVNPGVSSVLVETKVVAGDVVWNPDLWLLAGEAVVLVTSGGAVLEPRWFEVTALASTEQV